jgi:monoamine oxidase
MQVKNSDLIIIGAGLTGMALAYYLRTESMRIHLVEARDRLGGRILTRYAEGAAPLEMGATWFGKGHQNVLDLLAALELDSFVQLLGERAIYEPISTSPHQIVQLPPNSDPSFRIGGGSSTLINKLADFISQEHLFLNRKVNSIRLSESGLLVGTDGIEFRAPLVVATLPPYLLAQSISVEPLLPLKLQEIIGTTHTWMGDSIKVALRYPEPFWRMENTSGTIFSNVGPIPEMYDHSDAENSCFALKGFLNNSYFSLTREERINLVLKQLQKYYGAQVSNYLSYEEAIWRDEPFTFAAYEGHILPHQNNGHHVYQQPYLNGRLFIAGSETATRFPGYMDGAIHSAKTISDKIKLFFAA